MDQLPNKGQINSAGAKSRTAEEFDEIDNDENEKPEKRLHPGPTYILGWDRANDCYINDLPDSIVTQIANKLGCDVIVCPGRSNADTQDLKPIACVSPEAQQNHTPHCYPADDPWQPVIYKGV